MIIRFDEEGRVELNHSAKFTEILYIAKSFTISLGSFIILQLWPSCFAAAH